MHNVWNNFCYSILHAGIPVISHTRLQLIIFRVVVTQSYLWSVKVSHLTELRAEQGEVRTIESSFKPFIMPSK